MGRMRLSLEERLTPRFIRALERRSMTAIEWNKLGEDLKAIGRMLYSDARRKEFINLSGDQVRDMLACLQGRYASHPLIISILPTRTDNIFDLSIIRHLGRKGVSVKYKNRMK